MQLVHSFTIPVTIDEAWRVLLDIERVAPCMPGAALDTVDGDSFTGTVKVRVGPVGLTYKGEASFVETDEVAHRAFRSWVDTLRSAARADVLSRFRRAAPAVADVFPWLPAAFE